MAMSLIQIQRFIDEHVAIWLKALSRSDAGLMCALDPNNFSVPHDCLYYAFL